MSRLIVKNIPKHITEAQLKDHFSSAGEVTDVKIIFKGEVNRRFCYIGFKTEKQAQKAEKTFHNTFVHTSKIQISFAKTKDDEDLPRPWSRYSKFEPKKQKKSQVNEEESKQIPLEKEEKFKQFLELMKPQNAETEVDLGRFDNPKARQKQLKEMKKKQMLEEKLEQNKEELNELFDNKVTAQPKPELNTNEKRLYVTNIPFNSNEGEVRSIFEKYGTITELKLPKGRGGVLTGYCFVTFSMPEEAMRAFSELDNKIIMGRILHVRPAFDNDKKDEAPTQPIIVEKSSYKKEKKKQMIAKLNDTSNWNTLFLNPNSILESIAAKYGLEKKEILSDQSPETAVRVSLAETQIIKETKKWLQDNGIDLSFLKEVRNECKRSDTIILVKNLQFRVNENDLLELFSRFGKVTSVQMSPNKSLAIVKFKNNKFADNAFQQLSYYKFKGSFLYLEWAPVQFEKNIAEEEDEKNENKEEEDNSLARVLYIKNLNFKTKENGLQELFGKFDLKNVKIVRNQGISMGYGFVEFGSNEQANKALRQMQNSLLDGHTLQISQSKAKQNQQTNKRKQRQELQPTSKIIIRNLPFEANIQELRALVKAYGEVKKVRMPKKPNNQHRGFAFVEFISLEEAQNAYEALQNTHFYGRKLVIEYSE